MSSRMDRLMQLTTQNPISLLMKFGLMAWSNRTCAENCSGHGECHNGTCLCEIQFEGEECLTPNFSYHVAFASIFFVLALVCLVQLVMCIIAEFQRMKTPSLWRACRVTTQKLLYFLVFLATIIRGAYFTSPNGFREGWTRSLMSAFYPLLLSGSSLIVCFWAEVFHLRDLRCERPQFLSKSFLGFVTFNVITYSLLLAELVTTTQMAPKTPEERNFYTHIFNGCYAVLLFIVVVFFLIYGVEVFFKVRGGFLSEHEATVTAIAARNRKPSGKSSKKRSTEVAEADVNRDSAASSSLLRGGFVEGLARKVDTSQLHQSRLGLVSQAVMLFIVVGFLFSETLSEFWKQKVPLVSRNWHDVVFHIVEIGVVLWFPCVLWNSMSPEQLWILNPKKLLKKLDLDTKASDDKDDNDARVPDSDGESEESEAQDCWICYDPDRRDAGPLIRPCQCRGDVSSVHHDCLRRWLVESAAEQASEGDNSNLLKCKVCGSAYQVERGSHLDWQQGFTPQHWLQTAAIVTMMCLSGAGAWVLMQLYTEPGIRMLALGGAFLVIYVSIRFLGLNTVTAYQRAKVSALNIMGQTPSPSSSSSSNNSLSTMTPPLTTISETVAVSIPVTSLPSKKKQKLAMQTQI